MNGIHGSMGYHLFTSALIALSSFYIERSQCNQLTSTTSTWQTDKDCSSACWADGR